MGTHSVSTKMALQPAKYTLSERSISSVVVREFHPPTSSIALLLHTPTQIATDKSNDLEAGKTAIRAISVTWMFVCVPNSATKKIVLVGLILRIGLAYCALCK